MKQMYLVIVKVGRKKEIFGFETMPGAKSFIKKLRQMNVDFIFSKKKVAVK